MSKFDDAVQISLNAGQDFLDSVNDVEGLVRDLNDSVQKATHGAVEVIAVPRNTSQGFKELLTGSSLGVDPEDLSRVVFVKAKGAGESRTLWEIKHSPDGYPITVTASDASVNRCATREDLEATFLELLQQGATGRKIKLLQENASRQAS